MEVSMQEIDEQFYKYPKMLMMADSYVSRKTGEQIQLGEIEKNVYVIMKARNEYFDSHYDKQSDIAEMCNISLRKASGVIREFMDNGIIEGSKVYSGGKHKNLKYTKVHCLELIKKVTDINESGKIVSTRSEPMGVLPDSLWVRPTKQAVKSTITPEPMLPYWGASKDAYNDDSGPF
jgi:transposase